MTATLQHPTTSAERTATGSTRWAAWGLAAGVLGFVAHLVSDPQSALATADRGLGAEIVELVGRTGYHVGAATGFLAVACLLVAAAGWRRLVRGWPDHLAAELVPGALVAAAGAMTIGYGFKGTLAIYLDGGLDGSSYPIEGLYALFMVNDLAPFFSWLGVIVAAGAVAVVSLRHRLLPRWMGVVSVLAVLPALGMLLAFGLTGFVGITGPIWLVAISTGLLVRGEA